MGLLRGLAMLASSAVIVPYTMAFICNLLHMWPFTLNNLIKALKPHQVYLMNCLVLRQIIKLKYLPIYVRWNYFYRFVDKKLVIKDLPFGRNQRSLDVYFPTSASTSHVKKPVIIYIFGGAYSSGDKNMYGLLCTNLANRLDAIVCCPNYSIYPHGYMDDMVQDVVDSIAWVYANISHYGGDRDQIILVGFSCGAHLCVMSLLELYHTGSSDQSTTQRYTTTMAFVERHFDDAGTALLQSGPRSIRTASPASSSTTSFDIINGSDNNKTGTRDTDNESGNNGGNVPHNVTDVTADSYVLSQSTEVIHPSELSNIPDISTPLQNISDLPGLTNNDPNNDSSNEVLQPIVISPLDEAGGGLNDDRDDDSVVTLKAGDAPSLLDLGMAIKGFIGISGVYDIGNHYEYEKWRGVERVSCMCRAAYGHQHFDRLSPTFLLNSFNTSVRFPPVTLIHGLADIIVPYTSSQLFARQLRQKFTDIKLYLIESLNHHEGCIHLMNEDMRHHDRLMTLIHESYDQALSR